MKSIRVKTVVVKNAVFGVKFLLQLDLNCMFLWCIKDGYFFFCFSLVFSWRVGRNDNNKHHKCSFY